LELEEGSSAFARQAQEYLILEKEPEIFVMDRDPELKHGVGIVGATSKDG